MTGTAERVVKIIPISAEFIAQTSTSHKQLRVAAYCRVSTDKEEQEQSFEAQVSAYTDKIQLNPEWSLAGIFADEGKSGTNADKRPDFMRMIRACKQKRIDMILTKSVSRFARNTVDCLKYVRLLKELNIPIIFEKEGINTASATSEMLITLLGAFAQSESESLSGNVKWGKRESAKKGNVAFSYGNFLGYRKGDDGKPEIVEEQAKIVRKIFESYKAGMSAKSINTMLVSNGVKSPSGKDSWSNNTILSILKNEKYKGDAVLQKTYIVDCISKKSKVNNGELPKYYVENSHPAIIDRQLFDDVQEEIARRNSKRKTKEKGTKTETGKYCSLYALTELLVCGNCGSPYRRVTWTSHGKKRVVWRCVNRLDYGTKYCKTSPTLLEENIKTAVTDAIKSRVSCTQQTAHDVLKSQIELYFGCEDTAEIAKVELAIAHLKEEMMNKVREMSENNDTDESQIRIISDALNGQKQRLAELKDTAKSAQSEQQKVLDIINSIDKLKSAPIEWNNLAIRGLLECVKVLSPEELQVIFKGGITETVKIPK